MNEEKLSWLVENVTLDEATELVCRLSNGRVAIPKSRRLTACPKCGHGYTRQWHSIENPPRYVRVCGKCCFKGYPASSPGAAKTEWNHAVEDALAGPYGPYESPVLGKEWRKG